MEESFIKSAKVSNVKISLKLKNFKFDNKEINTEKYLNFFVIKNKFSYVVFKKGKNNLTHVNITKIRKISHVKKSVRHFLKLSKSSKKQIYSKQIDNITVTGKLKIPVEIIKFISRNNENSKIQKIKFNTQKFPGLFVKLKTGENLTLFGSGSFIILGLKSSEQINSVLNLLNECIKNVM